MNHRPGILGLFILISLCCLFLSGCSDSSPLERGEELSIKGTTFSFEKGEYPSPLHLFPEYKLAPGDVLDVLYQIRTWEVKEEFRLVVDDLVEVKFIDLPDLDQSQNVRPDGKITMPYLGEVMVAGRTVAELTTEFNKMYGKILRKPNIYVTVPRFSSHIKELKADLHTAPRGLSRLVTIRPDGYCTFPMVGDVLVAGRTIPKIHDILDARYQKILPGLHVDLFLERHSGSVVYVLGQVGKAGAYAVAKPITVLEAITLAGGYTTEANLDKVVVFRRCKQDYVATKVEVKGTLVTAKDSMFFYLRPDDIVHVPRRGLATAAETVKNVMDILTFRGWSIGLGGDLWDGGIIDWDLDLNLNE